ncbi:phosphotransferase family protein [Aspergillus undulatus]|uniref:phosphotransferase family protein n=1 Tax=Aspergillus undulatus TaxID=1810928 RepID=UPI003CCCD64F
MRCQSSTTTSSLDFEKTSSHHIVMSSLLPVSSVIETELSGKLVSVLQQHFLIPVHVDRIYSLAGYLHPLYLIRLSNETNLLLKCSPSPMTTLPWREHVLLDTEARFLSLLNKKRMPYIPQLLHYDPLGELLGPTFLIRHHIPGSTLQSIEAQLTTQERNSIDRSLGFLAKRIAQNRSDSFGSLGQVANAKGNRSWREAFLALFESILRDAEDVFVNLPYGEIRYYMMQKSPALDEVLVPRLVVVDFGQPSQVLVDPKSKRLCGITGFGTAVWGDVYMAHIFDSPSPPVMDGFGSCSSTSQAERTRQLLYSCFRAVHRIVLQYYGKNRDTTAEVDARRQLMTTLGRMAIL